MVCGSRKHLINIFIHYVIWSGGGFKSPEVWRFWYVDNVIQKFRYCGKNTKQAFYNHFRLPYKIHTIGKRIAKC